MRTVRTASGMKAIGILALAAALAACGGTPKSEQDDTANDPGTPAGSPAGASDASPSSIAMPATPPPAAFAQCLSCHALQPGRNGIGPSLAGIVGRKAASVPGFAYSPALSAANLTWDRPTLDRWLTAPMKTVPGTRMIYAGLSDPARRKEVIDYLETLK